MNPTSSMSDERRQNDIWMIHRIKGNCNYRRTTLEYICETSGSMVAFGSMGSVVMKTWQRSNGR